MLCIFYHNKNTVHFYTLVSLQNAQIFRLFKKMLYISIGVHRKVLWGFLLGSYVCRKQKVLLLFCWNFLPYSWVIFNKNKTTRIKSAFYLEIPLLKIWPREIIREGTIRNYKNVFNIKNVEAT